MTLLFPKVLEGRVCVIAGAGSSPVDEDFSHQEVGIGRATAIALARSGAVVVVNDKVRDAARVTSEMIIEEGGTSVYFEGDLRVPQAAADLINFTVEQYGTIDVLHHNIGIGYSGRLANVETEVWEEAIATNLMSAVHLSRAAIPHLKSSTRGAITLTSSLAAVQPRGLTPYSVTKGAIIALTKTLAVDHGSDGIRCNCIMPGPVFSPLSRAAGMSEERRSQRRQASPLRVEGTPWDIASAAVFLASDYAKWITGVVLPVDGGVSLVGPL